MIRTTSLSMTALTTALTTGAITRLGVAALLLAAGAVQAAAPVVTTFDNGREGWRGPQGSGGISWVGPGFGNDAPAYRTVFQDFGITFSNQLNPAFIGDYTVMPSVAIGLDVNAQLVRFFGSDVTRDLVVELRDYDNAPAGYPYVSVWATLGTLDAANPGWHTLSVLIPDTSATALPAGWGGYGAEDPVTFAPMLPADRTFTSVLAGVDEIAFTTLVPGYFYGATTFVVSVDNLTLAAVPEPASALLLAAGLGGLLLRQALQQPAQARPSVMR